MDLFTIQEVAQKGTLLALPLLHTQMLHLTFPQTQIKHPNPLKWIDWKLYSKCRGQIPSANVFLNVYLTRKALQHETDIFTHIKGLLYKHITDSGQKFLALVIPKSWKYTVLVEAHDKLGHQGNSCTYCLVKRQYYWKGMNKDIRKYIANCALCHREKAKIQHYPLQMMEIPDRPFDKIAINLITECDTSTSGNKHILTIIDHLTGWPEAFPIPDKNCRYNSFNIYK